MVSPHPSVAPLVQAARRHAWLSKLRFRLLSVVTLVAFSSTLAGPGAGMGAASAQPRKNRPGKKSVVLESVNLESVGGHDRLIVKLSHEKTPFYIDRRLRSRKRLEIRGAQIGSRVRKRFRGDDASLVRQVDVKPLSRGRIAVEVEHVSGAHVTAIREGKRLVWLFSRGKDGSHRPRAVTVARERLSKSEQSSGSQTLTLPTAAGFVDGVPKQVRSIGSRRRYTGRRVDLDFKDADIHNILRLIADVGRVNIVTGDDVSGTVTIRMRNVPWDEALDVILQAKNLGMVRRG